MAGVQTVYGRPTPKVPGFSLLVAMAGPGRWVYGGANLTPWSNGMIRDFQSCEGGSIPPGVTDWKGKPMGDGRSLENY